MSHEIDSLLIHGVDKRISKRETILIALQHFVKFSLLLSYVIFIAQLTHTDIKNFVSLSLIMGALATLLMAFKKPIGGHCFIPAQGSVPYFACIYIFAKQGSLALVLGATILLGLFQIIISFALPYLKCLFNKPIFGLILFSLGVWAAVLGVSEFFHPQDLGQIVLHGANWDTKIVPTSALLGLVTLVIMLGCWLFKSLRPYCILTGILIGWILGAVFGFLPHESTSMLPSAPWFYVPSIHMNYTFQFSASNIVLLVVVALYASFELSGLSSVIQNINYDGKLDPQQTKRANIAAGVGVTLSGLAGGMAQSPVPGSLGDMMITGIFSRVIAYVYALILLVIAFIPKVALFMTTIPAAVNGAAIVFMGAVMTMYGIRFLEVTTLKPWQQKAAGYALLFGLLINIAPSFYKLSIFDWFTNPALFLSIIIYIVLNFIFSIGKRS